MSRTDERYCRDNARALAWQVLRRVDEGGYADLVLDSALSQTRMEPRDRALATELVYGVLRRRGALDFALARFCRQPLAKLEPGVCDLLRLGAYQLLFLDRIPARAAVHETVELTRLLRLQRVTGFVNGILRALGRGLAEIPWPDDEDPLLRLTTTLSMPGWLAQRWIDQFGPHDALSLAETQLEPAPVTLRVNVLRVEPADLLQRWQQAGVAAQPCCYAAEGLTVSTGSLPQLPGLAEGLCQPQDEASMLVSHLLQVKPGERILDVCAAPGGKTTHLAALTQNRSPIVALDLHEHRLRLLEQGARRLGCTRIETHCWNLTTPCTLFGATAPERACFDAVLVDAPCSGLGVLRRNPELRWRRQPADIAALVETQKRILDHAAECVAPGGRLLYSLCTTTPEESDGVVDDFLARHEQFSLEDARCGVPATWLELFDARGCLRTRTDRHAGMDCFFAARLRRR